jgi:tetratricopeptide (TPR) repeat protein
MNRYRELQRSLLLVLMLAGVTSLTYGQKRPTKAPGSSANPSINIQSEPNAIVWLDEVRRGVTDASGKLSLTMVSPGRHVLRVRATGFKEASLPLLPGRRGSIVVHLVHTNDVAELAFQQAEEAREKAKDDEGRKQALELYRNAVRGRPSFPAANVGLARVLMDLNQNQEALIQIGVARQYRPAYAEASAVEGRIFREMAFTDEAIKSFQRALREARGFQPEAHVGLARVYEERGQYEAAVTEYQTAIKQLSDSEPVIYQLLGAAFEKLEKYKEAVVAYEQYLKLAPNGSLAPAVRSIIDQLRREAAGQGLSP